MRPIVLALCTLLVPALPARAADCLPEPTWDCLVAVAVDGYVVEYARLAGQPDDYDRLYASVQLDERAAELVSILVQADAEGTLWPRLFAAMSPAKANSTALHLVLDDPARAGNPTLGPAAEAAAEAAPMPTQQREYDAFLSAVQYLIATDQRDKAQALALAGAADVRAAETADPETRRFSETGDVVDALLALDRPAEAESFLTDVQPKAENAYQWLALARYLAEHGQCDQALLLVEDIPPAEEERLGSYRLDLVYPCKGIDAAIRTGLKLPLQELYLFGLDLAEAGKSADALVVAGVVGVTAPDWGDSIRREVARAAQQGGQDGDKGALLAEEAKDPYQSARTAIEWSLARARLGQPDPALFARGLADLRRIDAAETNPYALTDLMILAGLAQLWYPPQPGAVTLDEVEAQLTRLVPTQDDAPFARLDASEDAAYLAIAAAALMDAMGEGTRAEALRGAGLKDSCSGSDARVLDCLMVELSYIARFAPRDRIGDLPRRAWELAEDEPEVLTRANMAWRIALYLYRPE